MLGKILDTHTNIAVRCRQVWRAKCQTKISLTDEASDALNIDEKIRHDKLSQETENDDIEEETDQD